MTLHPTKIIMKSSHERRLTVILLQIAKCCGTIDYSEDVCSECRDRIKKCSRLVGRWQISLVEYAKLVRRVFVEYRSDWYG